MKLREFLTQRELSSRMSAGTLYRGVMYCVEESGYEYELVDGKVQITGVWWI